MSLSTLSWSQFLTRQFYSHTEQTLPGPQDSARSPAHRMDFAFLGLLTAHCLFSTAYGLYWWYAAFYKLSFIAPALFVSFLSMGAAAFLIIRQPGTLLSSCTIAATAMIQTAVLIHLSYGQLETHFGVFVFLALMLVYSDAWPILTGAITIALHHVLFYVFQAYDCGPVAFPSAHGNFFQVIVHALYVILESVVLIVLAYMNRSMLLRNEQLVTTLENSLSRMDFQPFDVSPQMDSFTARLQAIHSEFARIFSRFKMATTAMQHQSFALKQSAQDLHTFSQHMDHETQLSHRLIESIHENTQTLNTQIHRTEDNSQHVIQQVQRMTHAHHEVLEHHSQWKTQFEAMTQSFQHMADHAGAVQHIVEMIHGIANQTRLLSINASIEAAHQDRQHQGFAVIADQVRQLSDQVQQSVERIQDQMNQLDLSRSQAGIVLQETASHVQGIDHSLTTLQQELDLTQQSAELMIQSMLTCETLSLQQEQSSTHLLSSMQSLYAVKNKVQGASVTVGQSSDQLVSQSQELTAILHPSS